MVILLKTKWLIFSRFVKLLIENKSNQGNEELQADNNNINKPEKFIGFGTYNEAQHLGSA